MEYFGAKFSITLGAWRLRFVLMLEDSEANSEEKAAKPLAQQPAPAPMRSISFN